MGLPPPRNRHSRVSGNPDGTAADKTVPAGHFWIPAYAGMTVGAVVKYIQFPATALPIPLTNPAINPIITETIKNPPAGPPGFLRRRFVPGS